MNNQIGIDWNLTPRQKHELDNLVQENILLHASLNRHRLKLDELTRRNNRLIGGLKSLLDPSGELVDEQQHTDAV